MSIVTDLTAIRQMTVHGWLIRGKELMEAIMRSILTALLLTASIPAFADCDEHGTAELNLKAAQTAVDQYHGKLMSFDGDRAQSIIAFINTAPPESDFTGDRLIVAIYDGTARVGIVDGKCMAHFVKMKRDTWDDLMKQIERAFV
jgi:hypothetical protein